MATSWALLAAAAGGALLAGFYLGGLWLTAKRLLLTRRPALWMLASFGVRTIGVALGLLAVSAGDPVRLVTALLAFVVVRWFVTRHVTAITSTLVESPKAGGDA